MEGPKGVADTASVTQSSDPSFQFKRAIAELVAKAANITFEQALQTIEVPKKEGHADYAVCVPKINSFNKLKGNPAALAKQWAEEFQPSELLTKASSAGPYLNFVINKVILAKEVLPLVWARKDKWGHSDEGKGQTVVVEYSSPNIAKPFHYGHLRSTVIGNFLKNVHAALG